MTSSKKWLLLFTLMASASVFAQKENKDVDDSSASPLDKNSPWLLAPMFSSNPKLGTSFGVMGGYSHRFDDKSRPSLFALSGQYSSTESAIVGAFARTSFDEDKQRVIAALMYGNVKNDYDDYLGTGVPLKNDAELKSFIGRYTYRFSGNWFAGAQGIYQNFAIAGATPDDDLILNIVGIKPYTSAGAGLVLQNDSRDSETMPTHGWLFNLNNMAYREALGGDDDYDVVRLETKYFIANGNGHVLAIRQLNHFTSDAPTSALASVQLRGYKMGQYASKNMSSLEVEERFRLADQWTATVFGGVAGLYGNEKNSPGDNVFTSWGVGIQYILKPKDGILLNLEYAKGESDNQGIYLKMGYGF
jgi:outer membrane protein assembly factor BamA